MKRPSSPATAGIASSVLPGLGQILVGSIASGGFLLASTIGAVAVTVVLARSTDRTQLLEMITDPDLILMLIAINALLGLIRLIAAADAWRRAGGRAVGLGIVALSLFTLVPHIGLGYVGLETRSTILKVFPSEVIPAAPQPTTTSTTLAPLPLVPAWSIPLEPLVTTTTTTTIPLGTDRFTVLLMGGDAGPGRGGLRTDSMIVASVDTISGDTALFSLPRNLAGFEFSDGTLFPGLGSGLLNEVYMWGQRNPERFAGPDPGIAAVKDVAETLLGIPIEHYVLVDMVGFVELVDAMGGVTVTNPKTFLAPLYDTGTGGYEMITFEPGTATSRRRSRPRLFPEPHREQRLRPDGKATLRDERPCRPGQPAQPDLPVAPIAQRDGETYHDRHSLQRSPLPDQLRFEGEQREDDFGWVRPRLSLG